MENSEQPQAVSLSAAALPSAYRVEISVRAFTQDICKDPMTQTKLVEQTQHPLVEPLIVSHLRTVRRYATYKVVAFGQNVGLICSENVLWINNTIMDRTLTSAVLLVDLAASSQRGLSVMTDSNRYSIPIRVQTSASSSPYKEK